MGIGTFKKRSNLNKRSGSGFTLVASLLLLLLLSGLAIGLMLMVNTEGKVGGADLQNNIAYHAAEGGIEKMTSDLAGAFQNAQSPTAGQICAVASQQPAMLGVTWKQYTVQPASGCSGALRSNFGQISSGQDQGLWAQIIPINMLATASLPGGQEVSMTRQAQVALIPVFQFGVFSESSLGFFSSPRLDFAGRVHTNSDLYLGVANCCTLTFHDKLSAYGNVITQVLPNGLASSSYNDRGTVLVPTAPQGCDGASPPTSTCRQLGQNSNEGSLTGAGGNPPQSSQVSGWQTVSLTTYAGELIDGDYNLAGCGTGGTAKCGTGAKKLSLPFVNGTNHPYEIIRRPPAGESPSSGVGESREYNMAQIRVLLSDDPSELPGGSSDANNVRLANVTSGSNPYGIATSKPSGANLYFPTALAALGSGSTYNMYFAAASNGIPDESACTATSCPTANTNSKINNDWPYGPTAPASGAQTLTPSGAPIISGTGGTGTAAPFIWLCPPVNVATLPAGCPTAAATYPYYVSTPTTTWNLIDGYLRVEYKDSTGNWNPVTMEWLQLGFARGQTAPTAASGNPINPNAILLLQQPADRRGNGNVPDPSGNGPVCNHVTSGKCDQWSNPLPPQVVKDSNSNNPYFGVTNSATSAQSVSMYNWYPLNFYDAREGEPRDTNWGDNSCTANGVMNAVEIDVSNLKKWLSGTIGTSGTSVDYVAQNGYILYYSDRRGMLTNPTASRKTGDSGLEDVVNASSAAGTPNGTLEPTPAGQPDSPEDVNQNGVLDSYGAANLGLGFYNGTTNINSNIVLASPDDPYGTAASTKRIQSCSVSARKNWVSGARHVLKLVDGALGNVPLRTDAGAPNTGGFTVASENPVYIQGDYNSNSTDTFWAGTGDRPGHSAAAVIADAVTVLSNNWADLNSMTGVPTQAQTYRTGATTYYRLAIAGGKNINFPFPTWENATDYGFGTDGGVHNFLRFLEDWQNPGATLNYGGSLVSMYYATYNTGLFKCCTYSVYQPPVRNYIFDSDFTTPAGLPPGTPLFRDVNTLSYRQLLTTRTAGQ